MGLKAPVLPQIDRTPSEAERRDRESDKQDKEAQARGQRIANNMEARASWGADGSSMEAANIVEKAFE